MTLPHSQCIQYPESLSITSSFTYLVTRGEVDGEEVPEEESRHVVQDQAVQRQVERCNSRLLLLERQPKKRASLCKDLSSQWHYFVTNQHPLWLRKLVMIHYCLQSHSKSPNPGKTSNKNKTALTMCPWRVHYYLIIKVVDKIWWPISLQSLGSPISDISCLENVVIFYMTWFSQLCLFIWPLHTFGFDCLDFSHRCCGWQYLALFNRGQIDWIWSGHFPAFIKTSPLPLAAATNSHTSACTRLCESHGKNFSCELMTHCSCLLVSSRVNMCSGYLGGVACIQRVFGHQSLQGGQG